MNKKVSLLFVLVLLSCCFANAQHITFKGMDLNCTSKDLANHLVSTGYRFVGEVYDMYLLEGTFAGENAELFVVGEKNTKLVEAVQVKFDVEKSWESLKDKYLLFKSSLSEKYGDGNSMELFTEPYYEGDGKELEAVESKKCQYRTEFNADNGKIIISIDKSKKVMIEYRVDTKKSQEEQRKSDL